MVPPRNRFQAQKHPNDTIYSSTYTSDSLFVSPQNIAPTCFSLVPLGGLHQAYTGLLAYSAQRDLTFLEAAPVENREAFRA